MIVGFNHNITYRGVSFHVQTEDGGLKRPQLVTLLYHGGTIISSQKTSYADIIKVDALDHVIEELAKEQHKGVLRQLTKGEFDERIVELGIPLGGAVGQSAEKPVIDQPIPDTSEAEISSVETPPTNTPTPEPVTIVEEPIVDRFNQPKVSNEPSLDDLIYDYLTAGQNQ
ncbi:MAG: hypothetical protein U9Q61_09405 [Thermodesulfobacteriota bacterium]|nr:hypothetical protein [Thermodesulfobacteriota bacterium]